FFFSSRRRHTRSDRDWSSDVCSSDLVPSAESAPELGFAPVQRPWSSRRPRGWSKVADVQDSSRSTSFLVSVCYVHGMALNTRSRSEERRVGKECRSG